MVGEKFLFKLAPHCSANLFFRQSHRIVDYARAISSVVGDGRNRHGLSVCMDGIDFGCENKNLVHISGWVNDCAQWTKLV